MPNDSCPAKKLPISRVRIARDHAGAITSAGAEADAIYPRIEPHLGVIHITTDQDFQHGRHSRSFEGGPPIPAEVNFFVEPLLALGIGRAQDENMGKAQHVRAGKGAWFLPGAALGIGNRAARQAVIPGHGLRHGELCLLEKAGIRRPAIEANRDGDRAIITALAIKRRWRWPVIHPPAPIKTGIGLGDGPPNETPLGPHP